MIFFLKGCIFGFSIAAPVGPIGLLCIRRTLTHGRVAGFVSGLGAATADFAYACIAGLGLTAIMQPFLSGVPFVKVAGAVFLVYLGVKTFLERPASREIEARSGTLARCFSTTLVLTITNPMTVLSFAGMLSALGASTAGGSAVAAGVFIGSAVWWLALAAITGAVRDRINERKLQWLNRAAGVLIAVFGLAALVP